MISIVIPCFNEAGNVEAVVREIEREMKTLGEPYRLFLVDDGSDDGTLEILRKLRDAGTISYVSFSRNFGHQIALKAGLDMADGDAVITMDADLQHPPVLLPRMIAKWKEGYSIVNTVRRRTEREGMIKSATSKFFYWVFEKLSGLPLQPGSADFRLLDKEVVRKLRDFNEPHLFLRGLIHWVGFNNTFIEYEAGQRYKGKTKYSLRRMLRFAVDGITSFSIKPLRVASVIGVCVSFFAALYILYGIYIALFSDKAIAGWASILVSVLFLGGLQMMFIGLLGEYIGKIFIETKRRPLYLVKEAGLKPAESAGRR